MVTTRGRLKWVQLHLVSSLVSGEYRPGGLLKFESRVSSSKTRVSSIINGRIQCFLIIQLKLETLVLILETRYSIEQNTHRPAATYAVISKLYKVSRPTAYSPWGQWALPAFSTILLNRTMQIHSDVNFYTNVNSIPAAPSPNSGARGGWSSGWGLASRSPQAVELSTTCSMVFFTFIKQHDK